MNKWLIIFLSFGYLLLLFAIAYIAEKRKTSYNKVFNNPYTYALALAVYCTAWTYYGSVGRAAKSGVDFLTIYLGPTIFAPLWFLVLRKIVRICKVQKISTLSDFVASRYGKNFFIGGLVSFMAVFGVLPYISIQLKAISESFNHITATEESRFFLFTDDTAFYIAGILALFTILFGIRRIDSSRHQIGLISAIAFESIFKLIAFVSVGLFVTFGLFDGFSDLFNAARVRQQLDALITFRNDSQIADWFWLTILSGLAVLLLPRQFHIAVKENTNEKNLNKAMWLFPLYLLAINIFVLPIALAGSTLLGEKIDADQYVLALPLASNNSSLAAFAYLGGLSAATGMIIVSTIALSLMVANSIISPALALNKRGKGLQKETPVFNVMFIRRVSIVGILFLAYLYFRFVGERFSLVSIGLISFVAVAQFAPAVLGGIIWKGANLKGAITGMIVGFSTWAYTLVIPTIVEVGLLPLSIMEQGLLGVSFLKPHSLFGLDSLGIISHGFFWSIFGNTLAFVFVSLNTKQTSKERNQAEVFVDIFKYSTVYESSIVWKGKAYLPDIKSLLSSFLGEKYTERVFTNFIREQKIDETTKLADFRLVNFAEKQLAGAIGTSSAHIMMSSIVREEDISFDEVFEILQESQQIKSINKELQQKSRELQEATLKLKSANEELQKMDKLKDEFISTVTHEMRTPITSIKAFSEILQDNDDLEPKEKTKFLDTIINETERMERLISQVLDLEKFESGKQKLNLEPLHLESIINQAAENMVKIIEDKQIELEVHVKPSLPLVLGDKDRLLQVMLNLLSNAIKFCNAESGKISISAYQIDGMVKVNVTDNGPGVDPQEADMLFQSFYQSSNQNRKKPKGSGLGLSICRKIMEHHQGRIWIENNSEGEMRVAFSIPSMGQKIQKSYHAAEQQNIDR